MVMNATGRPFRTVKQADEIRRHLKVLRDPNHDVLQRLWAYDGLIGRKDLDDDEKASRDAYVPELTRLVKERGEVVGAAVIYTINGAGKIARRLP